jgi:adenine phosphoribosyltransferase
MAEAAKQARAEMLVAVESRGFLFGAPMALHLNLPLVIARKPGKLPGDLEQVKYGLEYGKDSLEMKRGAVPRGARVSIIDDVLATGGTCLAAADLVARVGGEVVSFNFLLEISGLHGRERLGGVRVDSLVAY